MGTLRRIDAFCYPLCVTASLASVVVGLVIIWFNDPSFVLAKTLGSFVAIALGSGFVMSATRVVIQNRKPDA